MGTDSRGTRLLAWLIQRLGRPRAWLATMAIALVLALPALASPFLFDDYVQQASWRELEQGRASVWDVLNDYFRSEPRQHDMEGGYLASWWVAPDVKASFWRPIAVATHGIDHILWPGNAPLMHLHTLLWFGALLVVVNALYRRLSTPAVAGLALAIYAWDDARGIVLSWVANRNALIASFFGVCVILAHDRWRRDGWWPGAWIAPPLLALGLLSAEMALTTTAFLFAHALYLDRGTWMQRMARLWPYLSVVVLWQCVYSARGYGAQGSGMYVHPLTEPLRFVARVIERAPVLLLGQLSPLSADFWVFYPIWVKVAIYGVVAVSVVLFARVLSPHVAARAELRFWLLGTGLGLLPISATTPFDRNLVFVGVGVAPLLASVFVELAEGALAVTWQRYFVGTFVVFHLVLSPLLLPLKCLSTLGVSAMLAPSEQAIPRDPTIAHKSLAVVWAFTEGPVTYSATVRDWQRIPRPSSFRVLAASLEDVTVTRPDDRTLVLTPNDGFLASEGHQLFRGPSRPFHVGEVVELSNMRATIMAITDDRRPKTVEFRFSQPLEGPELVWMRDSRRGLIPWTPPKVGETVLVSVAL